MDINLHSKNINLHSKALCIEISGFSVTAAYSPSAVKKRKREKRARKKGQERMTQLWRGKIRDKALRRKTLEDVHPWGKFRVNGALFNMPGFYKAFDIKPGDKLLRTKAQRPVIW